MSIRFDNDHVSCMIDILGEGKIIVQGKIAHADRYRKLEVLAPNPIDRRTSYHGSGLPFPCPTVALDNTPNRIIPDQDGNFFGTFLYPNSYYTFDGRTKVLPSIFFMLQPIDEVKDPVYVRFELPEEQGLFLRTLTYRPGHSKGPIFYSSKDSMMNPIPRSAEQVMRDIKQFKETQDKAI